MVDIKGLDKAQVLKALYDNSHVQRVGFFQSVPDGTVTVEHCEKLLKNTTSFDYLCGRVLKIDIGGDAFDERLYDQACGEGAAQRAVDSIRTVKQDGGDSAKDADTTKDADGEKKELTMEEKVKMTKDTVGKIMEILKEVPPEVSFAAFTYLKMMLPGMENMGIPPMMGGLFMPPMGGPFRGPFPFKGRFG